MNKAYYFMDDKQQAVSELQFKLRFISQYDTDIPTVLVDGIYGAETREAVRIFQAKNGLSPTGRVNFDTFTEINLQHEFFVKQNDNSGVLPDFSELEGNVISPGERSEYVTMLKLMISKISERDERFSTEIDNYFNERTENHIKDLQEIFGHEVNGLVDLALWKDLTELTSQYNSIN